MDFPASARHSKPTRFANRAVSIHAAERKKIDPVHIDEALARVLGVAATVTHLDALL
ncbi:MAG: hypothetical protein HRT56_05205 [Coraliomargarita sp.]|nr:hypothetical protein [Coraliomargarita sp.]